MKKILWPTFIILILLTNCQFLMAPKTIPPSPISLAPALTPKPWKPVPLAVVNRTASAFDALIRVQGDGWRSTDKSAFRAIYADDAVMKDATYGDYAVGIDRILGIVESVTIYSPSWKSQILESYIGREGGVTLDHLWNLKPGNYAFTQDDPMVEVDWLQTEDKLITRWTLFYGLDSLEKGGEATQHRLDQTRVLLSSYQSAWSSGDPQKVAKLYSNEAVIEDTLFGEKSDGRDAIISFSQAFFTWHPGAQWRLSVGFGEGLGQEPLTGGLYTINVKDLAGQPCEVRAAVLLQVTDGKITHEHLFYEPQSLIKCGWAQ